MEALLVVTWVATLGLLAALALPVAARLFARFPDRGAALALPVALATVGLTTFWVGQLSLAVAPYAGVLVLAGLAVLAIRTRSTIEIDWRSVGEVAAVFLVAFAYMALSRAIAPGAVEAGGEKFLDYGLLKTLLEAGSLPAEDFWFAGEPIRYYYGGQLVASAIARLTGTDAAYAYNLAMAAFYATLVTAVYGVAGALYGTDERNNRDRSRDDDPPLARVSHRPADGASSRGRAVAAGFVGTLATIPRALAAITERIGAVVVAIVGWCGRRVAPGLTRRIGDRVAHAVGSTDSTPPPAGSFREAVSAVAARSRRRQTAAIGAVLVAFAGTLATPARLALGLLPPAVAHDVGRAFVAGIRAPYEDALAQQTSLATFSLWNSRYVVPGVLNTFPHWEWHHGDLHAHVVSTPFLVLVVGCCLAYYRTPAGATHARRRRLGLLAVVGVLAGLLGLINLWSMPTALGLAALTVALSSGHPFDLAGRDEPRRWMASAVARPLAAGVVVVPLAALGVAAGAPFFLNHLPYSRGVSFLPPRSPFVPFLLAYGLFAALFVLGLVLRLRRSLRTGAGRTAVAAGLVVGALGLGLALVVDPTAGTIVLVGLLALLGYVAGRVVTATEGPSGAFDSSEGLDGSGVLGGSGGLDGSGALDASGTSGASGATNPSSAFVAVLVVGGAGLLFVTEVAYANIWPFDPNAPRWNTVYKVSMQVWVLWGLGAAAVLGRFLASSRSLPDGRLLSAERRGLLLRGSVAAIVLLSATFGVIAANARVGDAFYDREVTDDGDVRFVAHDPPPLTLDATRYIEEYHPDAAAAIDWLDAKPGTPVVVTSPGWHVYTWQNAPATFAATPTLAGWEHEIGYRGQAPYDRRVVATDAIYAGSWANASDALARHDVAYVYVGSAERERYGDDVSFEGLRGVELARDFGDVEVYAVDQSALAVRDAFRNEPRPVSAGASDQLTDRYCLAGAVRDDAPAWAAQLCDS